MNEQNELMDLREYGRLLRQSWGTILVFVLAGCLAALAASLLREPTFRAQTEIAVESADVATVLGHASGPVRRWDDTFIHTQKRILQSSYIVGRTVEALLAASSNGPGEAASSRRPARPAPHMPLLSRWLPTRHPPSFQEHLHALSPAELAAALEEGLSIDVIPKTRVFLLQVKSPCAAFAAEAANRLADQYAAYIEETYASSVRRTFTILERQVAEAAATIKRTASALVEHKKRAELRALASPIATTDDTPRSEEEIAELKRRVAQGHPDVIATRNARDAVEQDIRQAAERYRPKHPRMQELLARRDLLRAQLQREEDRVYAEWLAGHQRDREQVESAMLEQELEAARKVHETLLSKMNELDFTGEAPELSVKILETATPPSSPAYPRTTANVVLGSLAGLMAGVFVAFLRAHARSRLISLALPDGSYPAPLLTTVPHIEPDDLQGILTGSDTSSPTAEAIKSLRTAVAALARAASNNVILITSPEREEGKSTVSPALAQSFVGLGRRVLLVDVDLRRGQLHRLFRVSRQHGLADQLASEAAFTASEVSPSLFFVPCGERTDQPAELLSTPRMQQFVEWAAQEFDMVIMDSPPLLPVTDAALLACYAGTRILVARSQSTHLEACRFAVHMLRNLGHEINGIILNDVRAGESSYYGYYHRYYYRGYRDSPADAKANRHTAPADST